MSTDDVVGEIAKESGKTLLGGATAAAGGVFGIAGAAYYNSQPGTLENCQGTSAFGAPTGCTKVVSVPLIGDVSSQAQAAVQLGLAFAFLVFVACVIYLVAKS